MNTLEQRILQDGHVTQGGILKVDSFLNHQMDVFLFREMGQELYRLFGDQGVTKILTLEASGIGIACITAQFFEVPALFAKKTRTKNIEGEVYTAPVASYTHGTTYDIIVSKKFLGPQDRVLVVDDFLARGNALLGMIQLVEQAGAHLVGCGIAVEKAFQEGGRRVRDLGVRVESLAVIASMEGGQIQFQSQQGPV